MYRVSKVLNNNGLIAIDMEDNQEYVLLGKGIGFGKKISQRSNSAFGLILLFLSLCMDGVCGMQQDVVVPQFKPSSLRLQVMLNIYGMGVSAVTAILKGELVPGVEFLVRNKQCLWVRDERRLEG